MTDSSTGRLYSDCEKCGGSGEWQQPAERTGNSIVFHGAQECPDCGGLGMNLSPAGQEVVDIILRLKRVGRLR